MCAPQNLSDPKHYQLRNPKNFDIIYAPKPKLRNLDLKNTICDEILQISDDSIFKSTIFLTRVIKSKYLRICTTGYNYIYL